jgi:hypothetical protein
MEEHSKRSRSEEVEPDEHGKRNLNDEDVEAHIRGHAGFRGHAGMVDEDEPTDEHGKRS